MDKEVPGLSEDTYREALTHAMYRINRQQAELTWLNDGKPLRGNVTGVRCFLGGKIPFSELTLKCVIGAGTFAEVYFGHWTGTVIAIKQLKLKSMTKRRLQSFGQEMEDVCNMETHPNILRFIGYCDASPNLCVLMEYMPMTLYDVIHIRDDIELDENERIDVIRQICEGLYFLHGKDRCHRKLTSKNVLLNYRKGKPCEVKVSDYCLELMLNSLSLKSSHVRGTYEQRASLPRYSAPEVLRGEILGDKTEQLKADIWSLAIVVHELIYDQEPYYNMNLEDLIIKVGKNGERPSDPPEITLEEPVAITLTLALSLDPQNRPRVEYMTRKFNAFDRIYRN